MNALAMACRLGKERVCCCSDREWCHGVDVPSTPPPTSFLTCGPSIFQIGTNPNPSPLVSGGSLDLTARLDDTCPPPDTSAGWCVSGVLTMASPSPAPVMCPMYGTNACCTADMEDAYLGGAFFFFFLTAI